MKLVPVAGFEASGNSATAFGALNHVYKTVANVPIYTATYVLGPHPRSIFP